MIIRSVADIATRDIEKSIWAQLAHLENVEYVSGLISDLHKLPEKQRPNARKQAQQIRNCLQQAREYFRAAESVSLATRPVLLYYCTMSFALAEVLLKQTGDSRLPKLRENHGAHGLTLSLGTAINPKDALVKAAGSLYAKPQVNSARERWGTFEVWRLSSREMPLCGMLTERLGAGGSTGLKVLMTGSDEAPRPLPANGISLYECLVGLPHLRHQLAMLGVHPELVRASVKATTTVGQPGFELEILAHPAPADVMDRFSEQIIFSRDAVNHIRVIEFKSGFQLTVKETGDPLLHQLPYGIVTTPGTVYFSARKEFLNEFGLYYAALHICGNFARYYPDVWLPHIELRSELSLAVEALADAARTRIPLLALSELKQTLFVPRDEL